MSNDTCGNCKYHNSEQNICTNVKDYKMYAGKCSGACHNFTKASVFDRITVTPEVLAPKFIYTVCTSDGEQRWCSTLLEVGSWFSEPEAIAATVEKLKEVSK